MRASFGGLGRSLVLLVAIWMLGILALLAIVHVEGRVDNSRRAQVVIAQMRIQQSSVVSLAFDPATSATQSAPTLTYTLAELNDAEKVFDQSIVHLTRLEQNAAASRIRGLSSRYFALAHELAGLVASDKTRPAASLFGASEQLGGASAGLTTGLDQANAAYNSDATRAQAIATYGTGLALGFVLIAFSVAFAHSVRAHKRSQFEAMSDALTRLGNRRKLFSDMQQRISLLRGGETVEIGIFDLDGFKAYNDTFGHPAGDALLRRLGTRLAAAVAGRAEAYRIGGDEFVVIGPPSGGEQLLVDAQAALTERGAGFDIGCSLGTTEIRAGITLEQALHLADQRLYANKRSRRPPIGTEVKDVLLQVLAEQNEYLSIHVGHVAKLATDIAVSLGLTPEEVQLTRLTAELHDVGKAAIPAGILNKPEALNDNEWMFMRSHTTIGERIVAAAPALARIAPLVRATHERWDGTGYPDRLRGDEIPLSSRIVAVVDAYDAMTGDRPYRARLTSDQALAEIHRCAGSQFDPAIADVFIIECRHAPDNFIPVSATNEPTLMAA